MDHVTFIPTVDQLNFTFGGASPVMRIRPATVLTLWAEDAYGGRITSQDDVASVALDTPYRPLTTFDTVATDTPASRATSAILTRPPASTPWILPSRKAAARRA